MTETQAPYIPEDEPTEAAVLRLIAAEFEARGDTTRDSKLCQAWYAKADAIRACMRAAGWDTGEREEDAEQHIWSAG